MGKQAITNVPPARQIAVEHFSGAPIVPEGTFTLPWGHPAGWPAIPDGRRGALRGQGITGLRAQTDLDAILAWFAKKADKSRHTLLAYRKEVARLLLWAAERNQALSDLQVEDFLEYSAFLRDPQPVARWVAQGRRHGIADPRWRPFAGPLSEASRNQALVILHDLAQFLSNANYLALNPLALLDRSPPDPESHAGRRNRLSATQWAAIRSAIPTLPSSASPELARARARWVFTLLYLLGPRLSDLLGRFDAIHPETIAGESVWVWRLVGKGNKAAALPFSAELVAEMMRLRVAFGQPALPTRGDRLPLVPRLYGDPWQTMHRSGLHDLIKGVIQRAAYQLHLQGDDAEGAKLQQASAHWLRHTAASETLDQCGGDLVLTAELMRHSDIRTTHGYTHKDLSQLLHAVRLRHAGWEGC